MKFDKKSAESNRTIMIISRDTYQFWCGYESHRGKRVKFNNLQKIGNSKNLVPFVYLYQFVRYAFLRNYQV